MDSGATEASASWSDPALLEIGNAATTHGVDASAVEHVLHKDGVTRQDPSFTVDLTDVEFTSDGTAGFKVKIGETELTISKKDGTAGGTAFAKGDKLSGAALATAIKNAANANATVIQGTKAADGNASGVLKGIAIGGLVYKAEVDGTNVKFTLQTEDTNGDAIKPQTLPADGSAKIPQDGIVFSVANAADGTFAGLDAGG
ncbi:MAG: hypothetical protein OSJ28_11630, partial [Desulfovibrio sp.]|nr:hypothetical protein [Desulfovibrio sp.]